MTRGIRFDLEYETMPWHKIDTVVFDIGNVLIYYAPDDFLERLFPGDKALQEKMMKEVYQGKYWPMFDRGTIEYEEAGRLLSQECGESYENYMKAITGWIDMKRPIEEGFACAKRCRRAGKRLWLLSNYARVGYERLREKFSDLFADFEGATVSCYWHLLKPEHEIYEVLIREAKLDPQRTLFIDDSLPNIEAANEMGIHGFHASSQEKMTRFFL